MSYDADKEKAYHEGRGQTCDAIAPLKPTPAPTHFVIRGRRYPTEDRFTIVAYGSAAEMLVDAKRQVERNGGEVFIVTAETVVRAKARVEVK